MALPEYCFYLLANNKGNRVTKLVLQGCLICNSKLRCDAKVPIYLKSTDSPIDISCTYPNCPPSDDVTNFQLRFQKP